MCISAQNHFHHTWMICWTPCATCESSKVSSGILSIKSFTAKAILFLSNEISKSNGKILDSWYNVQT